MAPINPNGQQLVYPKSRIDRVKRQFNKRVVAITTDSLRIGKQNKNVKRRIGKSPSEGKAIFDGLTSIANLLVVEDVAKI